MSTLATDREHKKTSSQLKVLFCRSGNPGFTQSGVTSLVQRLITKTIPTEPRITEIGFQFYATTIQTPSSPLELLYLIAQANEKLTFVTQKASQGLSLIVFCISVEDLLKHTLSDMLQSINKQLKEHHTYDKLTDCGFLLAVTKSDLVSDLCEVQTKADSLLSANRIPNFSSYVICSAKTNYGCEKLEKEIASKLILSRQAKFTKSSDKTYIAESKLLSLDKFGIPALHHSTPGSKNSITESQIKNICATLDELLPCNGWEYKDNKFNGTYSLAENAGKALDKIRAANCGIIGKLKTLNQFIRLDIEQVTQDNISHLERYINESLNDSHQSQACIIA